MQPVIVWGMVLMLCVFGIGLLSAVNSQRRHSSVPPAQITEQVKKEAPKITSSADSEKMGMAARGATNGEENIATVGHNSC
jgi:hypothetical protein